MNWLIAVALLALPWALRELICRIPALSEAYEDAMPVSSVTLFVLATCATAMAVRLALEG